MDSLISSTMDRLKSGDLSIDQLLSPGKYLYDINYNELKIITMPSGFRSLDRKFMFLKESEGELIVVGGRPSSGKSAFMFQLALNVSKHAPVHIFSLEMNHRSIVRRLLSQNIGYAIPAIQMGLVDEKEIKKGTATLREHRFFVDDRSGLDVHALCDAAKARWRKEGTRLVVVDYLQLLRVQKGHSTNAEIGEITRALKALAKDIGCPVIVGSQFNRQCEIRGSQSGNYRPNLSDLRESGNIEQDADIVLAVHREYQYTRLRQDEADIIVLKNRNGIVGEVSMKYYAAQTKFEDNYEETI